MEVYKNKKNFWKYFIVIVFLIFLAFFLYGKQYSVKKFDINDVKYVKIVDKILKIELALTSGLQEKGLSGRKILREDEGMLFVFNPPKRNYFWMKEMNFPIDMIWFDENFEVVFIKKNALPESFPETFGPAQETEYVLEVVAGFSENNNLKVGDKVEFLP